MKLRLLDFQSVAVREILESIDLATENWIKQKKLHAISLSSMTGSGKTVIAASVIEAMFNGTDDFGIGRDIQPVILWFSDRPNLNKQTLLRIYDAAGGDSIGPHQLKIIENDFSQDQFHPRTVYFLNTQKLSDSAILAGSRQKVSGDLIGRQDDGRFTIWDTIRNTIENEDIILYFVLDEAHRGLTKGGITNGKRLTIVKKLIDGHTNAQGRVPPMPIVWGISATDKRFRDALSNRSPVTQIRVRPEDVQQSGLVKSYIKIDFPETPGEGVASTFVRYGAKKFSEICDLWERYCKSESKSGVTSVKPLMILQIPNTPSSDDVGRWIDVILEECSDVLNSEGVCNVLEGSREHIFGEHAVSYASPELIQKEDHIRLVIAKEAITTGWDCPRAEVLVSLRPAKDEVYITQLIGRMMRAPLALPIRNDFRLNGIDCILPYFDHQTVTKVVSRLTGDDFESVGSVSEVLLNSSTLSKNRKIKKQVWEKFESIKTYSLPRKSLSPLRRMNKLSQLLVQSDLVNDAGKFANRRLMSVLTDIMNDKKKEFKNKRNDVLNICMKSIEASVFDSSDMEVKDARLVADRESIQNSYQKASRLLSTELANFFINQKVELDKQNDIADNILRAQVDFAALVRIEGVKEEVEEEASRITEKWLSNNDIITQIGRLSLRSQEAFRQVRETGSEPIMDLLSAVNSYFYSESVFENDGNETLEEYSKHMYLDTNNKFLTKVNNLEKTVIEHELDRRGMIAWYRNSPKMTAPSLGVVYGEEEDQKILRPDFIFFSCSSDGEVVADIVDPHGSHLQDYLLKMKGLANYADTHKGQFGRIESVTEIDGKMRCLNFVEPAARRVIQKAKSIKEAFSSHAARDYL